MTEMSGRLTWNEVADIYQHNCGGTARILPMDTVFDAVEKLPFVHLDSEGYLHRILDQKEQNVRHARNLFGTIRTTRRSNSLSEMRELSR